MPVSAQANDWLVFIDGVQVPYQGITVSFGIDAVTRGSILLDPDIILTRVRPRAVIALFCRDRYGDETHATEIDEILDGYHYYGGGELAGYEDVKDPQSRQFTMTFESDLGLLGTHQAFTFGLGGNHYFGQVVGTSLINPIDISGSTGAVDLLSIAALGSVFSKDGGAAILDRIRSTEGESDGSEDFALRIIRMISWFASANASLRMQVIRSRLLNKMVGVQDKVLDRLVSAAFAQKIMSETQSSITAGHTVFDIVQVLMREVGYHVTTIPLPKQDGAPKNGVEEIPIPKIMEGSTRTESRIRRNWYRNDYVMLPNLFYSAPPPCNIVFPDMIGGRSVSRNFGAEPTRSVFEDPFFGAGARLVFVHTDGLDEELDGKTPDVFWANFAKTMSKGRVGTDPSSESAYASSIIGDGGTSSNLLKSVSDDELERGIVVTPQVPEIEYTLAFARTLNLKKLDGQHDLETFDEVRSNLGQDGSGKTANYLRYVQSWLKYNHQLKRFNRPTALTLRGHRWMVPGFSAIILDDTVSYQGHVNSLTITIDADGVENTQVGMNHVRPVTPYDKNLYSRVRATTNRVETDTAGATDDLNAAFNADTANFEAKLAEMRDIAESPATAAESPEFSDLYNEIVAKAAANADTMLGPGKTVAGSVTAQRDSDIATMHVGFLGASAEPAEPGELQADSAIEDAVAALDAITAYNNAQIDNVANRLPAQGATEDTINAINRSEGLFSRTEKQLEALISKLDTDLDFPTPPDFYNEDFIKLESLDKMYKDVLGCEPFYTGAYAKDIQGSGDASRGTAYIEHTRMLRIMSRVFRGLPGQVNLDDTAADGNTLSSWEDVRDSGTAADTMAWQHQKFLKRDAQTLRNYLTTHGFEVTLGTLISDEPSPTVFYQMKPKPAEGNAVDGYSWDNSVISGLVDDRELAPLPNLEVDADFIDGELSKEGVNISEKTKYQIFEPAKDGPFILTDQFDETGVIALSSRAYTAADLGLSTADSGAYLVIATGGDPTVTRIPETNTTFRYDDQTDDLVQERRGTASSRLTGGFRQDLIIAYSRRHFGSRGLSGS